MKILLGLSERQDSVLFLARFLEAVKDKHHIKVAGFNQFNTSIDWNLNALKPLYTPNTLSFDSDVLESYYNQVKYFNPDLIISDLEVYTSYVAEALDKPIWQVSPNLLHYATPKKEKMAIGFFRSHPYFFNDLNLNQRIKNIIYNSDKNLVYSHFGDAGIFKIEEGYEWVRPYHIVGKESLPCQHNIVAAAYRNKKQFINYIRKHKDAVLFSAFNEERYRDIALKSVYDWPEYACNLKNSNLILNQGHTTFLADAFYNGKSVLVMPDYEDQECAQNARYVVHYNFGSIVGDEVATAVKIPQPRHSEDIKYLHEHLETL